MSDCCDCQNRMLVGCSESVVRCATALWEITSKGERGCLYIRMHDF